MHLRNFTSYCICIYIFLTFFHWKFLDGYFCNALYFLKGPIHSISPENWYSNPFTDSYCVSSNNCLHATTDWPQIIISLWDLNKCFFSVHSCTLANSCVFPLLGYFNPAIVRVLSELNTFANSHRARVAIRQEEGKGNKDKTEVLIGHCHTVCK